MASSRDPKIEGRFASLQPDDYDVTSLESRRYNCIAWAGGRDNDWWEPVRGAGYYWPDDMSWDDKVESLCAVFASLGFEKCAEAAPEPGYETVAIYGEDDAYLHAARQIDGG